MKGQADESADSSAGGHARAPAWRRALRSAFWTAGLSVLVFLFGFGVFSSHIGRLAAPPQPEGADAIIVLTGGQARIDAALNLLKAGKGRRLLISGVNPVTSPEDIRRASGADAALFSCCIDIDRLAADTVGNAMESAKWLSANDFGSVILVTNNYHMPRSMLEMRRFGAGARIMPYPVVNTPIDGGEWLLNADALRVLFTEYTKFIAAVARDMLDGTPAVAATASVRR